MKFNELLHMYGLDANNKIKLVRHQDKKYDLSKMYRDNTDEFEKYQSFQGKNVFKDCKYIISFLGMSGSLCKFIGIYEVVSEHLVSDIFTEEDEMYKKIPINTNYYYKLKKTNIMNDLVDRLVIDWGLSALAWAQWLNPDNCKEVIEILPAGYYDEFPGFEDFVLSYNDLKLIINNPVANKDWHKMLSSIFGIYLIVDLEDGKQYVGSAYGDDGILGRWKEYAKTRHGNNKLLVELLNNYPNRYLNFQYTILRTLPKTLTSKEVIIYESLYKNKLGSRAFGLNSN